MYALLLLLLLNWGHAQDGDCDYYNFMEAGRTYFIYNPGYPDAYPAGKTCRWIMDCPKGYNCRIDCPLIDLPKTDSCSGDRLLVSRTGDPQLIGADKYCGRGTLTAVSKGQRMALGFLSTMNSSGGRFRCQASAQLETASGTCTCGLRKRNRIVGGEETGVNEFRMMAGLEDVQLEQIKCGSVIISQSYLVTAAHCVVNRNKDELAVRVGEHDVTTEDSPYKKTYRVANITVHPKFTPSNYNYDIAIVQVTPRMEFNEGVGPVCLPFKFEKETFAGKKGTILGWGTLFPGGPDSNTLMKVDVDVISQQTCQRQVPDLTSKQMCTYTPGKDACQDDSGGPLLYTDPTSGLLFSVGIVSYGRSCASRSPGVNTRVTEMLQWIVTTTRHKFCVK